MEENFTISTSGERESGDDYSITHIIIRTFMDITPELIKVLSEALKEKLPRFTPVTGFVVSQVTECNDLIYIQLSGSADAFMDIEIFAEGDEFYEIIEPILRRE